MTTVTLTLANRCAGGSHLRFELTGDRTFTLREDLGNILSPITDDEIEAWIKCTIRMVKAGRTNAQAIAALQAGVTVTV
jgi:hypothetical protein